MVIQRNTFIDHVNLSHLLDRHDANEDYEEVRVIKHYPYYCENQFTELLKNKSGLCILDLDIRNMSEYAYLKSLLHGDHITATKILAARDHAEAKRLSFDIKENRETWLRRNA